VIRHELMPSSRRIAGSGIISWPTALTPRLNSYLLNIRKQLRNGATLNGAVPAKRWARGRILR
jgi:hypothetical protein